VPGTKNALVHDHAERRARAGVPRPAGVVEGHLDAGGAGDRHRLARRITIDVGGRDHEPGAGDEGGRRPRRGIGHVVEEIHRHEPDEAAATRAVVGNVDRRQRFE